MNWNDLFLPHIVEPIRELEYAVSKDKAPCSERTWMKSADRLRHVRAKQSKVCPSLLVFPRPSQSLGLSESGVRRLHDVVDNLVSCKSQRPRPRHEPL